MKNVTTDLNILSKVIVALDGMSAEGAITFLEKCSGKILTAKIGMELFYKHGTDIVTQIKSKFGIDIFLDLKLHDIPNTVAGAIKSLSGLPIKMLTIHLSGGGEMIKSAIAARDKYLPDCKLLGVTYLTSLDESAFKHIWGVNKNEIEDKLNLMFKLAIDTKIDGIVLSANELLTVDNIEKKTHHKLMKICPGIRFQDEIDSNNIQDQKRVQTPDSAVKNGATYIVMGRSLTSASGLNERINKLAMMG